MMKARIMARKPQTHNNVLSGATIFYPISISEEFSKKIINALNKLFTETEKLLIATFDNTESVVINQTFDASITNNSLSVLSVLRKQYKKIFDELATGATKQLISRLLKSSKSSVTRSVKGIASEFSLHIDVNSPRVKELVRACVAEMIASIKSMSTDYLNKVEKAVIYSITSGNGLQDLKPFLESQRIKTKNYAFNESLDLTRKTYGLINASMMQDAGIEEFEWIHTGGSNNPREFHADSYPKGLNHGVFRFDDPPVIDKRTGLKGLPSFLKYCRCTLKPVIRINKDGKKN